MSGQGRIAAFVVLLVVIFGGSALLGGAVDPSGSQADEGHDAGHGESEPTASGEHGAENGEEPAAEAGAAPSGLQVAEDGYRLVVDRSRFPSGEHQIPFAFRILDESGEPVTEFELEHEKELHFIVVRRDLTGFQHLHPTMGTDGTWTTRVDLPSGGVYRAFADFKAEGTKRTLGADVHIGGPYRPRSLPEPHPAARTEGGLEVSLRSENVRAGEEGRVEFEVRDGDELVNNRLQTYLGAAGHLVALRAGDLAYLHTHPEGDELAFEAIYPSVGSYRLYVQFRYQGKVQTAAFTQEAGG